MNYKIGNKLHVNIDGRSRWAVEHLEGIGTPDRDNRRKGHLSIINVDSIDLADQRELEPDIYIGDNVLTDIKYGVRIRRDADTLILESDRPALEWLLWLIHVSAVRAQLGFVHGAGLERNGQVILFPSWGGVGKTALAAGFINEYDWKLLGDDLVLVDDAGLCLPYPKPMVLYPYHRSVFPEVFSSGKGPVAPSFLNEWLSFAAIKVKPVLRRIPALLAFARKYNPQSVRLLPSEVFGQDAISDGGNLRAAIWLERMAGINEPVLTREGNTLVSRIIGSTINEFDPHCVRLTNTAMGLGMLHLDEYWSEWRRILENALVDKPQLVLNLPVEMPVSQVPSAVRQALMDSGLW